MDFVFLWPFAALLLVLPIIVRLLFENVESLQNRQALCVPFFQAFQNQTVKYSFSWFNFSGIIFSLAYIVLVASAMRPVSFGQGIYLPSKSRQMMLVLDVSGSMAQQDFVWNNRRTTRLNAIQNIADDFIKSRTGDAVGLTIFGSQAYLYTPLTLDTKTAAQMLSEIGVGMAGDKTAMGDALTLALKQMKNIPSDKKVIILLSDGYANAGSVRPEEVIEPAKNNKVKIYTVGLGSENFFGQLDFDEGLLKKIASETGGKYYKVKTTADLKKMYDELNEIEPVEIEGQMIRPQKELFWIPLSISMLLFFVGLFFKEVRQ